MFVHVLEEEALDLRVWSVRGTRVTYLERIGDRLRHNREAVQPQREIDVGVAAAFVRLRRGLTLAPIYEDLEVVVGIQRLLQRLDELATPETFARDDA